MFTKDLDLFVDKQMTNLYHSLSELFTEFVIHSKKELYLVGGCVRDLLLGKDPKDYDLTTNATPDEVKEILAKIGLRSFDSGIKHGTLTIIDDFYKQTYEITTYRTETTYTDHRHPDEVKFSISLEEDLKRRDFTINSFAYDFLRKQVSMLDETYLSDLELGVIKCVGNPEERFTEDALRMLRALRFSAQLGFTLDYATFRAIQKLNYTLDNISVERCRDELTKIILSDHVEVIDLLRTTGLCCYLGGVRLHFQDYADCPQVNKYHYTDVWHHTLDVIKYCPKDFEIRFAALFHDFGKLERQVVGADGYYHYYGHPEVSAVLAEQLTLALKFTTEQQTNIIKLVKYHDEQIDRLKSSTFKKLVAEIGIDLFYKFLKLRYADAMAHKLHTDNDFYVKSVSKAKERFAKILRDKDALTVKDLKINGYDLMTLGYQKKEIGDQLQLLLEKVLDDPTLNTFETLYEISKK